jgi:hypothetical protein
MAAKKPRNRANNSAFKPTAKVIHSGHLAFFHTQIRPIGKNSNATKRKERIKPVPNEFGITICAAHTRKHVRLTVKDKSPTY